MRASLFVAAATTAGLIETLALLVALLGFDFKFKYNIIFVLDN
jgi:hypothetical protein